MQTVIVISGAYLESHSSAFELVVFDCDGVLVDSERISNRVFCAMLNELGLTLTLDDMFERFVGRSTAQCEEIIQQLLGSPPPQEFFSELRHNAAIALESEVQPIAGVSEVIDALEIPFCVASSGEPEKIRLTLGKTGLLDRFEGKIFSAVEVEQPKPAPDVFLHAAAQMGINPVACVVIEDTPVGVLAGLAAGMHVYGFAANTPEYRLRDAGAHIVFTDMADLTSLVARRTCA